VTVKPKAAAAVKGALARSATARKKPRTAKQVAAGKKWAAAGRAAQAASKKAAKSGVTAKKKAALPRSLIPVPPGTALWLPGCNDLLPVCAVTAVANHLLAATGVTASDADMLALHDLAGGDDGARIGTVLDAACQAGLAGIRLRRFGPADFTGPGLVCGISTRRGYHAALSHPYGMVSWGLVLPRTGELMEAWALEWEEE
jgi:hypothetical protein